VNPTQIIAVVKDVAIVAFGVWLFLFIRHSGQDAIKLADMQAVQKQIAVNATQEAQWNQQHAQAEAARDESLKTINATIVANRTPVLLRITAPAPSANPVPGGAGGAQGGNPSGGGPSAGPGGDSQSIDLRPAINAFESKYEAALADCRAVIASWPNYSAR
jgi:hypothetical protein